MRIVKNLEQYGHIKIVYVGMTESEKQIVEDLKDDILVIIDSYVQDIKNSKQFKGLTQEVVDFINMITDQIADMQLETEYKADNQDDKKLLIATELNRKKNEFRMRVNNHLHVVKAKAAGINVSDSEIDAWIAANPEHNIYT